MEDDVSRSGARGVHHFAQHGERTTSAIVRDAPRPVGAEIGYKYLDASGDGHDLVWMVFRHITRRGG